MASTNNNKKKFKTHPYLSKDEPYTFKQFLQEKYKFESILKNKLFTGKSIFNPYSKVEHNQNKNNRISNFFQKQQDYSSKRRIKTEGINTFDFEINKGGNKNKPFDFSFSESLRKNKYFSQKKVVKGLKSYTSTPQKIVLCHYSTILNKPLLQKMKQLQKLTLLSERKYKSRSTCNNMNQNCSKIRLKRNLFSVNMKNKDKTENRQIIHQSRAKDRHKQNDNQKTQISDNFMLISKPLSEARKIQSNNKYSKSKSKIQQQLTII